MKKICIVCSNEYLKSPKVDYKQWDKSRFCGRACFYEYNKHKTWGKECLFCSQQFKVEYSTKKQWDRRKYCSRECMSHGFEKELASFKCEECGLVITKKVKKENKLRFCGNKCAGRAWARTATENRGDMTGDKNPSWKGGITPINHKIRTSIEYILWRKSVFTRDNWTCQECGERGNILHAHHIKPFARYPELRTSIENGITLCYTCHKEIHKKYGN